MATLSSCERCLLVACGENVAVFDFSSPENVCVLALPSPKSLPGVQKRTDQHGVKNQRQEGTLKEEQGNPDRNDSRLDKAGQVSECNNRVLAIDVSSDGQYVAVCDDLKFLHVFHRGQSQPMVTPEKDDDVSPAQWTLESSRCVSRRCTVVRFSTDNQTILVADKSGDVFSFPLHATTTTTTSTTTSPTSSSSSSLSSTTASAVPMDLSSNATEIPPTPSTNASADSGMEGQTPMDTEQTVAHEGDANAGHAEGEDAADDGTTCVGASGDGDGDGVVGGKLVLGHLSMLLDMILVDGDTSVVTSDRDEKIRVSRYPDAYNIHTYCLGHTAFVITLAYDHAKRLLFSGSGDGTVAMWSMEGELFDQRNCLEDFPDLAHSLHENASDEGQDTPKSEEVRTAVQQVVYCDHCHLLFVAIYKCAHILLYRVNSPSTDSTTTGSKPSLQPVHLMAGHKSSDGPVVSICLRHCVLWVVREAIWPAMSLDAFRIGVSGEKVEVTPITSDQEGLSSSLLQSVAKRPELLQAPSSWQDSIPTLWKSQIDGYISEYKERKRQRIEASSNTSGSGDGGRHGKAHKQKWKQQRQDAGNKKLKEEKTS